MCGFAANPPLDQMADAGRMCSSMIQRRFRRHQQTGAFAHRLTAGSIQNYGRTIVVPLIASVRLGRRRNVQIRSLLHDRSRTWPLDLMVDDGRMCYEEPEVLSTMPAL